MASPSTHSPCPALHSRCSTRTASGASTAATLVPVDSRASKPASWLRTSCATSARTDRRTLVTCGLRREYHQLRA